MLTTTPGRASHKLSLRQPSMTLRTGMINMYMMAASVYTITIVKRTYFIGEELYMTSNWYLL